MPPPFFSAVSATTAPATPGSDLTARSAAARSGSSSWARAAGTVAGRLVRWLRLGHQRLQGVVRREAFEPARLAIAPQRFFALATAQQRAGGAQRPGRRLRPLLLQQLGLLQRLVPRRGREQRVGITRTQRGIEGCAQQLLFQRESVVGIVHRGEASRSLRRPGQSRWIQRRKIGGQTQL